MAIIFNNLGVKFSPSEIRKKRDWLMTIAKLHGRSIGELSINWCSDDYILNINKQFLQHDYFTDIITFDLSDETPGLVSGELLISIDSVRSNSAIYNTKFHVELLRVMSHGLLHLLGFDDHSDVDIKIMRLMEDISINLYDTIL